MKNTAYFVLKWCFFHSPQVWWHRSLNTYMRSWQWILCVPRCMFACVFICIWWWLILSTDVRLCPHWFLSQVSGSFPVLPLSGLSHGHVDALQPLLSMFFILSFQHICLTVSEDLKGSWKASISTLLGYHLLNKEQQNKKKIKKVNKVKHISDHLGEILLGFFKFMGFGLQPSSVFTYSWNSIWFISLEDLIWPPK